MSLSNEESWDEFNKPRRRLYNYRLRDGDLLNCKFLSGIHFIKSGEYGLHGEILDHDYNQARIMDYNKNKEAVFTFTRSCYTAIKEALTKKGYNIEYPDWSYLYFHIFRNMNRDYLVWITERNRIYKTIPRWVR